MSTKFVSVAIFACITCIYSKILFNQNQFIIEFKSFNNIQDAFKSGDLICGLENENMDVDMNIFNGSHLLFSYERVCFKNQDYSYTKREDVYNKPFMCGLKFRDPIEESKMCNTSPNMFTFNDTCAIIYEKACEVIGPCIGQYKGDQVTSEIIIKLGNDTVKFTSQAIQHALGKVIFCDRFEHTWGKNETQYDDGDFVLFQYGEGTCGIKKIGIYVCTCCEPSTFSVQDKYGHTVNDKAINKNDSFSK